MIASDKRDIQRIPDRRCVCGHWLSSHALPGDADHRKTAPNCSHADAMTGKCQCREYAPGDAA